MFNYSFLAKKYLVVHPLPLLMRILTVILRMDSCNFLRDFLDIEVPNTDYEIFEFNVAFKLLIQIKVVL